MTATSNRLPEQEPGEIEALLPWYAAGTLNARDAHRVTEALARDPALARQYAVIREEYAETIALNESLGAPSVGAMQKLFAAIDAEPPRRDTSRASGLWARLAGSFAALSPRTLMAGAAIGALAIMLQAGVIGTILMQQGGGFQPASEAIAPKPSAPAPSAPVSSETAPLARSLNAPSARRAVPADGPVLLLVRFAPNARISDITALLDAYRGTIVGNDSNGEFRIRFDIGGAGQDGSLIRRLEAEAAVSMAVPAP